MPQVNRPYARVRGQYGAQYDAQGVRAAQPWQGKAKPRAKPGRPRKSAKPRQQPKRWKGTAPAPDSGAVLIGQQRDRAGCVLALWRYPEGAGGWQAFKLVATEPRLWKGNFRLGWSRTEGRWARVRDQTRLERYEPELAAWVERQARLCEVF